MVFATGMLIPPAAPPAPPAAPPVGAPPAAPPGAAVPEDGHAVEDAVEVAAAFVVLAEPEEHAAAVIAITPAIATKAPVLDLVT
jgi:hypothetical protein